MKYKALFDDVMYKKYDTAPLSDDNAFIEGIRERAVNMEKKKFRMKRPVVIAASLAAAAALTFSVGALAGWDITELFTQRSQSESDRIDRWLKSDGYAHLVQEDYPYMQQINVPENAGSYTPDYAHDRELTARITQELDQTFEFEKFNVYMKGCMYDGLNAVFFFDIEYKNIFDALAANPKLTPVSFYSPVRGGCDGGEVLDRNGCVLSCTERMMIGDIVDGVDFRDPFEVHVLADNDHDGVREEKVGVLTLTMPDIDDLIYDREMSLPVELTGFGSGTLDNIRISPTMIALHIRDYDGNFPHFVIPVYVTMKDGTVLPLGWDSDKPGWLYPDGSKEVYCCIHCTGTVLDVNNIKSIQFYNDVIEIG